MVDRSLTDPFGSLNQQFPYMAVAGFGDGKPVDVITARIFPGTNPRYAE